MKFLFDHWRIITCQKLLLLIVDILPVDHPESKKILTALFHYGKS